MKTVKPGFAGENVMMNDPALAYLFFGYLPFSSSDPVETLLSIKNLGEQSKTLIPNSDEVIKKGIGTLKFVFSDISSKTKGINIVPLSGGLDSRAILGGLLENFETNQIQAVTFGVPGTWDFEIGQSVASKFGIRCEKIDLSAKDWRWATAELVKSAAGTKRPVGIFDSYINRQIPERFGCENTYWSGFLGGTITGTHLLKKDSPSWEFAVQNFMKKNRAAKSVDLLPQGIKPKTFLPDSPFVESGELSFDEQLDLGIRQECLIKHTVIPHGYDYKVPYHHPQWIQLMLNVPRQYRENQWLYKQILKSGFPSLFSLPVKNNYGLQIDSPRYLYLLRRFLLKGKSIGRNFVPGMNWGIDPRVNYLDFNDALRHRQDLMNVVYENLQDLKNRKILNWFNIDKCWIGHKRKEGNFADAILLLVSLEINIKAKHFPSIN